MNEIKILSSSSLRPVPGETSSEEISLLFRLGETLRGKVLQQITPQHAFLQLRGQRLFVESRVPLPPGVELPFRVEEVQPRVILKLLPPENPEGEKIYSLLKKYLSGDVPLEKLSENLSALMKMGSEGIPPSAKESYLQFISLLGRFSPSGTGTIDPGALQRFIAQSGFFWENKIARWIEGGRKSPPEQLIQEDIKGLGLKLLDQWKGLTGGSGPESEEQTQLEGLKQDLKALFQKIELYQLLNLRPTDSPDRFYLFLPFWLGSHLQFVEMNLSFPQKESTPRDREEVLIVFLLNLPALGKVKIEAHVGEKALLGQITVSDSRIADFLHQEVPALKKRLEKLGFQAHIQVSTKPVETLQETFLRDLEKGSQNFLSVII